MEVWQNLATGLYWVNFVLTKTHTVGLVLMAYALIFQVLNIVTVSVHVKFFSHAQYVESFKCLPSTVRMKHFKDLL